MLKKIVSMLIVFALLVPVSSAVAADNSSPLPADIGQEKVYCNATVEDDFADDRVMVVLSNDASLNFNAYSTADFTELDCINVQDMTQISGQRIKEKVEIFKTAVMSRNVDLNTLDTYDIDTYNQVLCIELAEGSKENVLLAIDKLISRDDVVYAGPDYALTLCSTDETDIEYYDPEDNWAFQTIDLHEAWEFTTGSASVVVGVIDSGIDANHPDLVNNVDVELSYDFITDTAGVSIDPYGHGTRIAGVIGADGSNDFGVVGVCWDVTLVSLRVMNDTGGGYTSTVAEAIQYAEELGIPILNLSARWYSHWDNYDYPLQEVISQYSGLFVCSAGNENIDNDGAYVYPANYLLPNLITVGASDTGDRKWSASSYGDTTVDIFAPGDEIPTTISGGGYQLRNATSIATPFVTGVAALLLSYYPGMSAAQIKNTILSHAEIVRDEEGNSVFVNYCTSGGRLNAYNVFNHVWTYSPTDSVHTHAMTCVTCEYEKTGAHIWVQKPTCYLCTVCGKSSTKIPIIVQVYREPFLLPGESDE